MIIPSRNKPEKIKRVASTSSTLQKALKISPKTQISKIKSVFLLNTQQPEFHSKRVPKKHSANLQGCNSLLSELQKDFNYNFSILDADKTQMLNYSRFSILLQSMHFINCPTDRTLEERSLILKAWKMIGNGDKIRSNFIFQKNHVNFLSTNITVLKLVKNLIV